MYNKETTELKTSVPTWGMVGKRLLLDAGSALIPSLPRILDKILDYPVQAMRNGYRFHMNRRGDDLSVRFDRVQFSDVDAGVPADE